MNSKIVNWYFDEKNYRLYINGKIKTLKRLKNLKRIDGKCFGLSGEIIFLLTRPNYTPINATTMAKIISVKYGESISEKEIFVAIYYQNSQILLSKIYEFIKIDYSTGNILINPHYTRLTDSPFKSKKVPILHKYDKKNESKRTLKDYYSPQQASEALDVPMESLPASLPQYKHPFFPDSCLYLISDVDSLIENLHETYLDESAAANYLGITSEQLIDFTATGSIKYVETTSKSGILYEKAELEKILNSISLN